jgi:hypothetical protein
MRFSATVVVVLGRRDWSLESRHLQLLLPLLGTCRREWRLDAGDLYRLDLQGRITNGRLRSASGRRQSDSRGRGHVRTVTELLEV